MFVCVCVFTVPKIDDEQQASIRLQMELWDVLSHLESHRHWNGHLQWERPIVNSS